MVWAETKVNCILPNTVPSVTRVCGYVPAAALPINQSRISDSMWGRTSEPNRQRFLLAWSWIRCQILLKYWRGTPTGNEKLKNNEKDCDERWKAGGAWMVAFCQHSLLIPLSFLRKSRSFCWTLSLGAKPEVLQVTQTRGPCPTAKPFFDLNSETYRSRLAPGGRQLCHTAFLKPGIQVEE